MALDLSLTYSQSNDAKTLTITDSTGEYTANNTGGWTAPNRTYTDIVVSTDVANSGTQTHLILDVAVTDKDGTETTYDTINLWDHNGGAFAAASELTWDFTPADFVSSGTAMGVATDKLDDGIYAISYKHSCSISILLLNWLCYLLEFLLFLVIVLFVIDKSLLYVAPQFMLSLGLVLLNTFVQLILIISKIHFCQPTSF